MACIIRHTKFTTFRYHYGISLTASRIADKNVSNVMFPNTKNKNIRDLYRGINEFKKGYQPRTNLVKDDRRDLVADPHKI
jgi:hypothetical protein